MIILIFSTTLLFIKLLSTDPDKLANFNNLSKLQQFLVGLSHHLSFGLNLFCITFQYFTFYMQAGNSYPSENRFRPFCGLAYVVETIIPQIWLDLFLDIFTLNIHRYFLAFVMLAKDHRWGKIHKMRIWSILLGKSDFLYLFFFIIFIYSRYDYNNEHKLCRASDRLFFKIRNTLKLCTLYTARVTMLAYHIIRAPAEYRSRDLPVPRRAIYHWATNLLIKKLKILNLSKQKFIFVFQLLRVCHCWWSIIPQGHRNPSVTVNFCWVVAFWEHQNCPKKE